jgi:RNA polymerase sporulation-specific sigma factor
MPTPDEDPMSILECLKRSTYPLAFRYLHKATGLNAHELSRMLSQLITSGLVSQVTYVDPFGFRVIRYRIQNSSEEIYVEDNASLEDKPFSNQSIEDDASFSTRLLKKRSKLSPEEEQRLIQKAQDQDDKKSESRLVLHYLPWLSGIAHSICNEPDKFFDLVQIGTEAFLKCIRRFDKGRGRSLPSYAYRAVWGSMLNFLVRQDWLVPLPETRRLLIRLIREATDRLLLQHGREPSIQEVADETWLTEETIRSAAQADLAHSVSSLESVSEDFLAANERYQPELAVEPRHLLESLKRAVSESTIFDDREKQILFSRSLLPITERKKLKELAADMKISTKRVHCIEQRAVKKLRKNMVTTSRLAILKVRKISARIAK